MVQQEVQPKNSWRWVRISAIVLLILVIIGMLTISIGIFDPQPLGKFRQEYQLDHLTVETETSHTIWLDEPLATDLSTLRLTAAFDDGELDSSYGLVIGSDMDRVIIALSPVGYLTVQRWLGSSEETIEEKKIIPWQPWPHIRTDDNENEIWVDIENGLLTNIRINREILWQEHISLGGNQIGLIAESYGDDARFSFQKLEHYLSEE